MPEDKTRILNRIAAGPGQMLSDKQLNDTPLETCDNYTSVNNTLKAKL